MLAHMGFKIDMQLVGVCIRNYMGSLVDDLVQIQNLEYRLYIRVSFLIRKNLLYLSRLL